MADNLQLPFEYFEIDRDTPQLEDPKTLISLKDFLGLFLCTAGRIEVNIDERSYTLLKGDMYFFTPALFVSTIYVSDDFQGIAIRVDYDFVTPVINNVLDIRNQLYLMASPFLSLNDNQYNNISTIFKSLKERIESENNEDLTGQRHLVMRELIKSLGNTIAYEIINLYLISHPMESIHQEHTDILVQEFITNVYKHYQKHREVNYYADQLCITPSYLSGLIKSKTGKPALQWIIDLVISDAKHQLQYSNASIKEITARLNFPTQSFFGKYFKQYVGMSPKAFRKSAKV